MISHITLDNFKQVSKFDSDLGGINVLVGANNAGKSSVLQGIHFTIMAEVARRYNGRTTVPQESLLYLPVPDFSILRHGTPYSVISGDTSSLELEGSVDDEEEKDSFKIILSKGRNYGNISVTTTGNNKFRQRVSSLQELYSAFTPGLSGIPMNEKLVAPAVLRNAAANGDANLYLRNIIYYVVKNGDGNQLNDLIQTVFPGVTLTVPYDPERDIDIHVNVHTDDREHPLELSGTGLLQIIQIMAYSVYFKPKLLLLDEPDEHLHPSNQVLLCDAIRLLATKMNVQIMLSTHSRHMIAALEDDARFIWMKNGKVCYDDFSANFYNILLDLGALDIFDTVLQGKYEIIFLTEDSDKRYLKKLLEVNGCDMSKTVVFSYNSCSHEDAAILLAEFIREAAKSCKIIIHRDRDFMRENEISVVRRKFESNHFPLWITDGSDIEAYFTTIEHICNLTGKTYEEVIRWQNDILQENHVEIQHKFESKRNDIKARLYRDGKLKGEKGQEEKWVDFITLFGKKCPTDRNNVVGKFMLRKFNANMSKLTQKPVNLLDESNALQCESLKKVLNGVAPELLPCK